MIPFNLLTGWQRVALLGLALLPLAIVVLACVPALVVLLFIPNGIGRVLDLITKMSDWVHTSLTDTAA